MSEIASLIDHTILRADATHDDVVNACREALGYSFASVCINPYWVPLVARQLEGSVVKVCTVIGFPLGASTTAVKAFEAEDAIRLGAREIDMVLNIGALRSHDFKTVELDIAAVVATSHAQGAIVKVILETALLNDDEKIAGCEASIRANADFVKTSTGFSTAGAKEHDIELMRRIVGPSLGVKASGGIRTLEDFRKMLAAGASRIGASASVKIVDATRA